MDFVSVQSVLKGFHATKASLAIGREYQMQRVKSHHDRNAFFLVDRGIVKASMPRELSRIIAPYWDNGKMLRIVCYPTGQIRVSEKGLVQLGGGIDMPCIFGLKCIDDNLARTLVKVIPNSHVRKKLATPEANANKIGMKSGADTAMPSSAISVGMVEEDESDHEKPDDEYKAECPDHDTWLPDFPQTLEMDIFEDYEDCSSSTSISSPLKWHAEKEQDSFVPSSVTPPGSPLADGSQRAFFLFSELNNVK